MSRAVVIEHAAAITPLGDLPQTVESLMRGGCALQPPPFFDVPCACAPFADTRMRDVRTAASLLSAAPALKDIPPDDTVFFYCSAKGDIRAIESPDAGGPSPLLDRQAVEVCAGANCAPARITAVSAACASGAIAVEMARELLAAGEYSHALLFGYDALSRFVLCGFHALGALSPTGARPFDASRDGLSLGEGAALAVLAAREARPGDILIRGAGSSNDANHRTGPSRTGEGLFRAARAACDDAALAPAAIGAVKCHGTATPYNDAMEAKALKSLFGDACPPCASFKGAIGHLSGAGSLVEICIAAECLKRRELPPTAGYAEHGVDEKIPLSSRAQPIAHPSLLCLSAGFGGINAATVLGEHAP